ncbi:MAG: PDZ domain-containing protein, partial [Chthoniobacterales bacterium]
QPIPLDLDVKLGDSVETLQVENNGSVVSTPGTISSVMVGTYPVEDVALLLFRITLPLQYRDNSFVLPAVRKGKLAGILMRYDIRAQFADLIPSPVIQHYLKALDKAPYQSFPRAEISFSGLRDPQLRKYLGITADLANRGIYITNVIPNGPAAQAGIKAGDVLLAVNGQPLDADGNYNHPLYGLIPFSYLTSTEAFAGQKIPFTIFRKGKTQDISVQVAPRDIDKMISPPYSIDKAPPYYILGGLVFQELSKSYLHEWGKNWQREAPKKLVYYDQYQQELAPDRGKIVILNQVLANEAAYGYNELNNLIVKSVNGKPIKSLRDLADAVNTPVNGYHRIEFEDEPSVIYLDPELSNRLKESIRQQYNLPALENLPDVKSKTPDNS